MEEASKTIHRRDKNIGVLFGALAFIMWGSLPVYWKLLGQIPAVEILAHRITWSFVFVSLLLVVKGDYQALGLVLKNKKQLKLIFIAALLITLNWFTYIWAVNSNFVLQASLGYYINPLVVSLLSMIVFKERFNREKTLALILATLGVLLLTVQYGQIPWVSLILAFTFAFYGLVKKVLVVDSVTGMALETLVMTPIALFYLGYLQGIGAGSFFTLPLSTVLLLMFSGVATATPLLWFAKCTKLVQFSTIGFMQYIAPTISFFLGVFLFKEDFSMIHLVSFCFIWTALIVYTYGMTGVERARRRKARKAV
ncbi:EamA family transporter RarD [Isachenkonia alkalipeptolytica]|uniref:EamA family transporter RarD n=1 Tax=Isachenkonia alkalipeptolytica TaxID=2565777 RepID=A0AA43XMJ9_9CLOT|nr:EamA family transporter RarD [Isachenkonia alkalipeptolytica]NBG89583.1 EamA family transporter RarD [Isachenkonia alkalipeptolytica]